MNATIIVALSLALLICIVLLVRIEWSIYQTKKKENREVVCRLYVEHHFNMILDSAKKGISETEDSLLEQDSKRLALENPDRLREILRNDFESAQNTEEESESRISWR